LCRGTMGGWLGAAGQLSSMLGSPRCVSFAASSIVLLGVSDA